MNYKRLAAYAIIAVLGALTGNVALVAYGTHSLGVEAASVVEE